jgi:hypothetical protein
MDAFVIPYLSAEKSTDYFALFRNVENAGSLRQRIIKVSTLTNVDERVGEERDAVNLAFIDARLVSRLKDLLLHLTGTTNFTLLKYPEILNI